MTTDMTRSCQTSKHDLERLQCRKRFTNSDNGLCRQCNGSGSNEVCDLGIRLLDIPTSLDDFNRYIDSQIELNKVNHNLSEADYKVEQESELKKKANR